MEPLSPVVITLSLVSHTNVGKTTLARTLLRRDVGEVLDQAHVTEEAEMFSLVETTLEDSDTKEDGDGRRRAELRLWDTPGFGDSVRLLERLRRHDQPILWFLQQTWDRITDRPLWSSQRAALNIRQEADVVLYLVNATEAPEEAGYVAPELELLDWLGVPVLVLLNQTGDLSLRPEVLRERLKRWRAHCERWGVVREVAALDAFSRSWIQESELFRRIEEILGDREEKQAMGALRREWDRRNLEIFERSAEAVARYLGRTAAERATLSSKGSPKGLSKGLSKRPSKEDKEEGMALLARRLGRATEDLMTALLAAHDLEGEAASEIDRQLDYVVEGEEPLDAERGALLGSVVSGAVGGLAADLLAGGLTFGGGLLAGALLGALGGAGLARGMQLVRGEKLPQVAWTPAFLDRLAQQTVLRYLAVAHFGRGRGEFRHHEASERWRDLVAEEMRRDAAREDEGWRELWKRIGKEGHDAGSAARLLAPRVKTLLRRVLEAGYPEASRIFGAE